MLKGVFLLLFNKEAIVSFGKSADCYCREIAVDCFPSIERPYVFLP